MPHGRSREVISCAHLRSLHEYEKARLVAFDHASSLGPKAHSKPGRSGRGSLAVTAAHVIDGWLKNGAGPHAGEPEHGASILA